MAFGAGCCAGVEANMFVINIARDISAGVAGVERRTVAGQAAIVAVVAIINGDVWPKTIGTCEKALIRVEK